VQLLFYQQFTFKEVKAPWRSSSSSSSSNSGFSLTTWPT
jgi:hypothetical protein